MFFSSWNFTRLEIALPRVPQPLPQFVHFQPITRPFDVNSKITVPDSDLIDTRRISSFVLAPMRLSAARLLPVVSAAVRLMYPAWLT